MARKPGSNPQAIRTRAAKTAAAMATPAAVAQSGAAPKKKINLAQFFREVRSETRKITWPSRRETWITSVLVAIMVALAAFFFWVVDAGVSFGITQILKLANG